METIQELLDYLWDHALKDGAKKLTRTAEILGIELETGPGITIEDLKNPEKIER